MLLIESRLNVDVISKLVIVHNYNDVGPYVVKVIVLHSTDVFARINYTLCIQSFRASI